LVSVGDIELCIDVVALFIKWRESMFITLSFVWMWLIYRNTLHEQLPKQIYLWFFFLNRGLIENPLSPNIVCSSSRMIEITKDCLYYSF
jgi:hypothetical protein